MRFEIAGKSGSRPVDIDVRLALLAGYTGRDRDAVLAHVRELARHGVPAPARVPSVYPLPPSRLTTATRIAVQGRRTAGEAEFVLYRRGGELLVGLGSDHTDRELEEHSVVKSKQCCDKPLAHTLWRYAEVADHWDELVLRSYVLTDAGRETYQEGPVSSMMGPEAILAEVGSRTPVDGSLVFSGTLPLIGGEFRFGVGFRAELVDPVLDRALVCEYAVDVLPELDE